MHGKKWYETELQCIMYIVSATYLSADHRTTLKTLNCLTSPTKDQANMGKPNEMLSFRSVGSTTSTFTVWPCKNISYGRGLQVCERPLIATHLEQSNYLANQKQGEGNKYNLTVFTGLFQVSLRALKAVCFFSVPAFFQCIHWFWLMKETY